MRGTLEPYIDTNVSLCEIAPHTGYNWDKQIKREN